MPSLITISRSPKNVSDATMRRERELRSALSLAPSYARARFALGVVLLREGEHAAARNAFAQATLDAAGDPALENIAAAMRDSITVLSRSTFRLSSFRPRTIPRQLTLPGGYMSRKLSGTRRGARRRRACGVRRTLRRKCRRNGAVLRSSRNARSPNYRNASRRQNGYREEELPGGRPRHRQRSVLAGNARRIYAAVVFSSARFPAAARNSRLRTSRRTSTTRSTRCRRSRDRRQTFPQNPSLPIRRRHGKFGKGYASGSISPGGSVTVTLGKTGIYLIGCAFHYQRRNARRAWSSHAGATPGPASEQLRAR